MPDDYAGNTSTTGTVSVGGSRSANIETAGDTDWLRVTLQAGYTYQFDMLGSASGNGTLSDPYMRIRDSAGNSLAVDDDGGSGLNARISGFTATTSGTYYISAGSSTSSGTGTYQVTATQTGTPTTPQTDDFSHNMLTSGQVSTSLPAFGNIETPGDTDWFKMNLAAGGSYTIDVLGSATSNGTLSDPYVQILDDQGNIVAANDDGGSGPNSRVVNFTPESSGNYFVSVRSFGVSGTGTYAVELTETFSPPTVNPQPVVSDNEFIVRLPVSGPITTYFNHHPYIQNGSGYYAIDVGGARYENVIAGVSGRVVYVASGNEELPLTIDPNDGSAEVLGVNQNGGFGNTVTILTDGGLYVSYSHLTDASIQNWVAALSSNDAASLQVSAGSTVVGQMGQNGSMWSSNGTPWHSHMQMGMGIINVSGVGRAPYADGRQSTNSNVTIHLQDWSGNIIDGQDGQVLQAGGGIGGGNLSGVEFSVVGTDNSELIVLSADLSAASGYGGNDTFLIRALSSYIFGGSGRDTADYRELSQDVVVDLRNVNLTGSGWNYHSSIENAMSGSGNDRLTGNALGNSLISGAGNDTLTGGAGNDGLYGGAGNDFLNGGIGNDRIDGGAGIDRAYFTGATAATVNLGLTTAQNTGHGTDTILNVEHISSGSGNDRLTGNALGNSLISGDGNDTLNGGSGNDALYGGGGNDRLIGGTGNDRIDGGAGIDRAYFTGATAATVNLGLTTAQNTGHGTDTILNVENISSGSGNDRLTGNALGNSLISGDGNDTLNGGSGNDALYGGGGNDRLIGGTGNDRIDGGAGADTFVFTGAFGRDTVTGFDRRQVGEVIDISAISSIVDFADLVANHLTQSGANAVITADANTITLTDVQASSLLADDFIF